MTYARVCAMAVGLILASQALAKDDLTIFVYPAIEGDLASANTYPAVIELQNDGPSTRGVVHMTSMYGDIEYPVDLPQGSQKRLMAYPELQGGGSIFTLNVPGKSVKAEMAPYTGRSVNYSVLSVSTQPGNLGFLAGAISNPASNNRRQTNQLGVAYCQPELLPDRLQGLIGSAAVILGEGSERLADAQVRALQEYVLMGGTLVFQGGASNPTLADPRWSKILPVTNFRPVNISGSRYYSQVGKAPFPASTITTGEPTSDALFQQEDGHLLTSERGFGLGRVAFLATDLTQGPVARWTGRPEFLRTFVRPTTYLAAMRLVATGRANDPFANSRPGEPDPFNFQLPDGSFIFWVLATYFVLVVPVNFLVLRKLKRGELAWVTTPLLSVGFAGVIFSTTGSLYTAQLASAHTGTLVVEQGHELGYVNGMSQVFFPRSGFYDLKLRDVDTISTIASSNGLPSNGTMNPVDVGQVVVDRMQVPNLTFSGFYYRQKLDEASRWFVIRKVDSQTLTVQNTSSHPMENAVLDLGERQIELGKIAPGQTVSTKGAKPAQVDYGTASMLKEPSRVALHGLLRDVEVGPRVGRTIEGRSGIAFIQFADKETL